MSLGTAAGLRDVATLAIEEFHLKIVAPNSPESVLQVLVSAVPHPRINVRRPRGEHDCGQVEPTGPSRPRGDVRSSFC